MARGIDKYITEQFGSLYSDDYRLFFKRADNDTPISPMHDIPLYFEEQNKTFNMVVEIPRWTNAKMEMNKAEELNPLSQDKDSAGQVRFVTNIFPNKGYIWNYGFLPQTWEDPEHTDPFTNQKGDGDPIDVCEIGQTIREMGEVVPVKILGTIALIDEGETDWKLLAIDTRDPMAGRINDIEDVEEYMPGLIKATVEWFKTYKVPDGNEPNTIGFDEEAQDSDFALQVVDDVHELWADLMARDSDPDDLVRACTQCESVAKISAGEAQDVLNEQPDPGPELELDSEIDKNYFLTLSSSSTRMCTTLWPSAALFSLMLTKLLS